MVKAERVDSLRKDLSCHTSWLPFYCSNPRKQLGIKLLKVCHANHYASCPSSQDMTVSCWITQKISRNVVS